MPRLALLCTSVFFSCSGDGPLPDTSTPLQGDISELPAQADISIENDAFLSLDTLSDALPDTVSQEPCNGAVEYCGRNYNQFVHACTHNAMSSTAYNVTLPSPNQEYTITRQLDDGIRCLMLDIYWVLGELFLCHGVCGPWGQLSLHDTLVEIRDWMDMNPRETLTLILETYVTKQQFLEALINAELAAANAKPNQDFPLFFHPKLPGSPWPTLRTMIDSNQRLVILTDEKVESTGWYLDWREFGWETPFNDPALDCSKGRGDAQTSPNGVFILNHFLTCETGGCTEKSIPLNGSETIINRAKECAQPDDVQNPGGQVPTFINVDHYQVPSSQGDPNIPDMIEAIHTLNQSGNWEDLP